MARPSGLLTGCRHVTPAPVRWPSGPGRLNCLTRRVARGVRGQRAACVGRHLRSVSVVWQHNNYAHNHPATTISRRIAESLLSGQARDISQGATLFYSPLSMPKEGDTNLHGFDIGSGLESVDGVRDRSGKPIRNYVPGWAQDGRRVRVFNVPEKEFKFYRE